MECEVARFVSDTNYSGRRNPKQFVKYTKRIFPNQEAGYNRDSQIHFMLFFLLFSLLRSNSKSFTPNYLCIGWSVLPE